MSLFLSGNAMTDMTAAEREIRRRIRQQGRITFAEFMQSALYHPVDGYYSSEKPFGAAGDYYTSPGVHPAFGALLAVQLYGMWRCLGSPSDFTVVEMGSGNGMLARDMLTAANELPGGFPESLVYIGVDRYAAADAVVASDNESPTVEWVRADELPLRGVVGCFISNELIDAFPVHRFQVLGGEALEVYVVLNSEGEFEEALDKPSTPLIAERLGELGFPLAERHRGEVSLRIKPWLGDVARALEKGFVITIDYGCEAAELYSARRRYGTLQTYYRHTEGSSPYRRIGKQDISAHVDFTLLQEEGRCAGLNTLAYMTQAELLSAMGIGEMLQRLRTASMTQQERNANMMGLRELVKPDGLGGFRALIQEKGTNVRTAAELASSADMGYALNMPMLSARHMPLMEGRYPHTAWEAPSLWGEWGRD